MTTNQTARRFFFLLLAGAAVLMALVARPLATPLFLATVLAVVFWPVSRKLTARLWNRSNVASGLVVLGVLPLGRDPQPLAQPFPSVDGPRSACRGGERGAAVDGDPRPAGARHDAPPAAPRRAATAYATSNRPPWGRA